MLASLESQEARLHGWTRGYSACCRVIAAQKSALVRTHPLALVFDSWHTTAVLVSNEAIHSWQTTHARELSSTERYAIAKIALFQAFDERPLPAQMKDEVRVRHADVDGIVDTLGL